jgi:hypothetical protein
MLLDEKFDLLDHVSGPLDETFLLLSHVSCR